jgi:hypothetical protein
MAWLLDVVLEVEGCWAWVHWRHHLILERGNDWICGPCHHNCSMDPLWKHLGCSKRHWPALELVLEEIEGGARPT